ncbi:DUF302 domain-containing protein [Sulfobacillus thermosulfidooxidans]|uniref:DUF302 domain-containing protein n=1 Tax=Sulfobacillus thermosulfidooxidans TaxID=28034 RepID=UPI00096BCF87|nr:DUF302 domain-containing protein [Sulfobacillus thermosulfidooxidans]OLZ09496.1 hypothetical protein BFX05_11005 [Sulfobacillus thermosulfidooxidans]OLZ16198.1 hypothetical protein BFX06_04035 [Sulfobacillus thermosulfidooxidans]OLZ17954.1 hypothetical protein BFX07_06095 [Sulfobacillus thermosulfidooxidans]
MFHYTVETAKNVPDAIESVEQQLKANGFGVLWHMDIAQKLQEKGVDFDQAYHVLEVCNPVEAKSVLTQNLLVGYFLPCKVVVYDDHGHTKIGLTKPTTLINLVEDKELEKKAQEIEEKLIKAINGAA